MADETRALLDAASQTHPDTCTCHNCAKKLRTALAAETRARESVEAEIRETAGYVEQLKTRVETGNRLRADLDTRLAEATALLERWRQEPGDPSRRVFLDTVEFLFRAPAQPAALLPIPTSTNTAMLKKPAAPEPSGELAWRESQAEDNENAWQCEKQKRIAAEAKLAAVKKALEHFREVTAAARRNREPKTGMRVPYYGEFCSATPSVIRDLEWFVRAFERALLPTPGNGGGQ